MNNPSLPPPLLSNNRNKNDPLNASSSLNNRIRRSSNAASIIIPLMKMTDPHVRKTMTSYKYTQTNVNNSNNSTTTTTTNNTQSERVYQPDNKILRQNQSVSQPRHKIAHTQKVSQPHPNRLKIVHPHPNSQNMSQSHSNRQKVSQPHPNSQKIAQSHTINQKVSQSHPNNQKVAQSHTSNQKVAQSHTSNQKRSLNSPAPVNSFYDKPKRNKPETSQQKLVQSYANTAADQIMSDDELLSLLKSNSIFKRRHSKRKVIATPLEKVQPKPAETTTTPTQSKRTDSDENVVSASPSNKTDDSQVNKKTPTHKKIFLPLLVSRTTPVHTNKPASGNVNIKVPNKANNSLNVKANKTTSVEISNRTSNKSNKTISIESNKATPPTVKRLSNLAIKKIIQTDTIATTKLKTSKVPSVKTDEKVAIEDNSPVSIELDKSVPNSVTNLVTTETDKSVPNSVINSVTTETNTSTPIKDNKTPPIKSKSLPFQITKFTLVKRNRSSQISSNISTPSKIDTRSSTRVYTPKLADNVVDILIKSNKNTPTMEDRTPIKDVKEAASAGGVSLTDLKLKVDGFHSSDKSSNKELQTPIKEQSTELIKIKSLPIYSSGLKSSSNKVNKQNKFHTKDTGVSTDPIKEITPTQRKDESQQQLFSLPLSPKLLLSNSKHKNLPPKLPNSEKKMSQDPNIIKEHPKPHKINVNISKHTPQRLTYSKEGTPNNASQQKYSGDKPINSMLHFKKTQMLDTAISCDDNGSINNETIASKIKQKSESNASILFLLEDNRPVIPPQQLWPSDKETTAKSPNENKGGNIFNNVKPELLFDDEIVQKHSINKPTEYLPSKDTVKNTQPRTTDAEGSEIRMDSSEFGVDIINDKLQLQQERDVNSVTSDNASLSKGTEKSNVLSRNINMMNVSNLLNTKEAEATQTSASQILSILSKPSEKVLTSMTVNDYGEKPILLTDDDHKLPESNMILDIVQQGKVSKDSSFLKTPKESQVTPIHAKADNENTSIKKRKHTGSFKSLDNHSDKKSKIEPTDPEIEESTHHIIEKLGKHILEFIPDEIMPLDNSMDAPTDKQNSFNDSKDNFSDDNSLGSTEKHTGHLNMISNLYETSSDESQESISSDSSVQDLIDSNVHITRSVTILRSQKNDSSQSNLKASPIVAPSDLKSETLDQNNLSLTTPSTKMEVVYVSDSDRNSDSAIYTSKSKRIKEDLDEEKIISTNIEKLEEESEVDSSSSVDPYEERKKFERNFTTFARDKLKDKSSIKKDLVSSLISSGIAQHLPLNGDPTVSVSNDICSVTNFEQLHTIFYQQIHKKDSIKYLPIDQIIDKKKLKDKYMLYPEEI
ncbi:hypothetical protein MOSE0_L05886 [Monosporozyma servazzii]